MNRSSNGMRNGISLVEMMIAVILFGVISVVGFKYSTNYYNTDLTAKKARIAALVEQATQLSNAYDLYETQFGTAPTNIIDLNASNVQILTTIPSTITEIGTAGWVLNTTDIVGGAATDISFTFLIADTATTADNEKYCAIFNNMIDSSLSVDVNNGDTFNDSSTASSLGSAFCYTATSAKAGGDAADSLTIAFIKSSD